MHIISPTNSDLYAQINTARNEIALLFIAGSIEFAFLCWIIGGMHGEVMRAVSPGLLDAPIAAVTWILGG